ncbi:MAG: Prolyl tripeptidyl peptidase precursor [Bacteroidetes bacterium ADurb.Bin408]|nr:MAG: Prolyl tripeptidyl peptidase precursor [Bacteroidetes bacterium ADurb.Bin408]
MHSETRFKFLLSAALILWALFASAQVKKVLQPDDYIYFNTLDNPSISDNGQWVTYEVNPYWGDGELKIKAVKDTAFITVPRAYGAKFSPGSTYAVFKIKPQEDSLRVARYAKKKKEQMPKDSLGIILLKSGNLFKYPRLKSFQLPDEPSEWFAFALETEEKAKDSTKTENKSKKNKIKTYDLVLARPDKDNYTTIPSVCDYTISKDGSCIVYAQYTGDSMLISEVFMYNTASGKTNTVFSSEGEVRNIALSGDGRQVAFIFSKDTADDKVFTLYYMSAKLQQAVLIADSVLKVLPAHYVVSPHEKMYFSDDNSRLYFSVCPYVAPLPKDSIPDEDKVSLDIWAWTDSRLMSQQLAELEKDKKKSYLNVYYPGTGLIYPLASDSMPDIQLFKKNNGAVALGSSALPYELQASWEARPRKDYYVVNVSNGQKKKILEKMFFSPSMSPDGRYVAYYKDTDSLWYFFNTSENTHNILTPKGLSVFYDDDFDNPGPTPPCGIAGWTKDDKAVLIYSKYDVWLFDLQGKEPPVNLTEGRVQGKVVNRYQKLDDDAWCIDPQQEFIVKFVNEDTMEEGFYSISLNDRKKFKLLLRGDCRFSSLQKARKAHALIFRKSTYTEFPDLWYTERLFENPTRISDVNPQQKEYNWGKVELVKWSFNGKEIKGLLYKPEDFDSKKKYPMITYFYEKTSQTLHSYYSVSPSRSVINFPLYNSNGYLIFVPDITYEIGKPGESALNIVLSGVYALLDSGFVDQARLGIHGQSWGGYQTLYIIAHTQVFKAAMAGAPVSNMTSAYGAIRKESGINRIYQYEAGQSRIGKSLWERRDLYIENSPLFYADKVTTPLLIMANDNDGAVPWSQGIEMFLALRRLQKPVWLLNYNNDAHNLEKKQNRIDLSMRMFQFFNHYLKEASMPQWMKEGIPATEKGRQTEIR